MTEKPKRELVDWSPEEEHILKENYPTTSAKYVQTLLRGRSVLAIKMKAYELKLKKIKKMPQIQKVYQLDITPGQFLDACSLTELQEVQMLLPAAIARKTRERNWRENPNHEQQPLPEKMYIIEKKKPRIVD